MLEGLRRHAGAGRATLKGRSLSRFSQLLQTVENRQESGAALEGLEHDAIRSICKGNGSALPLPLGEGWGEGLRSLVVHRPLTRFALDDASHRQSKSTSPRRGEVKRTR
jgi:hypothetical protein